MKTNRRELILGAVSAGLAGQAGHAIAQTPPPGSPATRDGAAPDPLETIDLWPGEAPGLPATPPTETVAERSTDPGMHDRAVTGIRRPRMAVFRPETPNGTAVLVTPGGGYQRVVVDKEGYELGRWLSARGYTVFVLFYRLPGEGWANRQDVPLADAQRAMRLVRYRAADFGIDPERVLAMGFSAGGHLCADLATRADAPVYAAVDDADALSARPRLAAPIYPVIALSAPLAHTGSRNNLLGEDAGPGMEAAHSPDRNVTASTPPCFLVHAEDDGAVVVGNSLRLRAALVEHGVPVETHLFTHGGHGFGISRAAGKPAAHWPELYVRWVESMLAAS
ncbi:alpha/beta hydrolase [Marinihelvus fidelis]|uniref:Alpha/beta hydrolase n=1 Tax=Marinihelvus fidelis TaxID=2613842 RepID=A0A5N0TCH1_9GAMM|nr:alpha/beta hydrolase [Marinihelvus fidelis]KAA9132732.1 alpha/beta hydrolase [Marinihelvus fidelis]